MYSAFNEKNAVIMFSVVKPNQLHKSHCITGKELLAIIDRLHFCEAQLKGHTFIIITDHKPLLSSI